MGFQLFSAEGKSEMMTAGIGFMKQCCNCFENPDAIVIANDILKDQQIVQTFN